MSLRSTKPTIALCALVLTACTGADNSKNSSAQYGAANSSTSTGIAAAPTGDLPAEEAARLAKQATFGPTPELIDQIRRSQSVEAWLDAQMTLKMSTYSDIAANGVPSNHCAGLSGQEANICSRDNFSSMPVAMRFYSNALNSNDQLRQRVAFAFSQIIVASDTKSSRTSGLAAYNQIFLDNAFGNFRDILKSVTLSPYMGIYLDTADSNKSAPNENYARELMQLFSIGVVALNSDGTPQTDNSGSPLPAFAANDVKEISRALTGWTVSRMPGYAITDNTHGDFSRPMTAVPARFDSGAKSFLGRAVPAGASQDQNVDAVVDAVFYHPNTAPFIAKRLIKQLTIANPTPAYVERVAAAFVDNGSGQRGDMKAVVRAIYTDSEARVASQLPGKVKDPVLLATSLARAIGFKSDGYAFTTRDLAMGQQPFRAPSVFGFYPDEYPLAQGQGASSPSSKLMNTATIVARHNFIYDWTLAGDATRGEYQVQSTIKNATGSQPSWAAWEANGADDAKTVDRINLVMLNGAMTKGQREALLLAMAAVKNNDPMLQARKRAQVALYIVASSAFFQVDR